MVAGMAFMLDHQHNSVIGWNTNNARLISYDYTIGNGTVIPSMTPAGGTIHRDGPIGVGTLSDVGAITPHYTGHLILQYRSCIKHISITSES